MAGSEPNSGTIFKSVASPRVFEEIAGQIKQAIFSKRLLPGDKLPTERELTQQFGASRAAVREALRVLENSGFIHMRTGKDGGAYVSPARFQPVTDAVQNLLKLQEIGVSHLYHVRRIVEPAMAEIAASMVTPEYMAEMEDNLRRARAALGDSGLVKAEAPEFHVLLAAATENPLLVMLCHIFEQLQTFYPATPEISAAAVSDHEALLHALHLRDLPMVRDLMEEHLTKVEGLLIKAQAKEHNKSSASSRPAESPKRR